MKNQEKLDKIRDFLSKLQGSIEKRKKEITVKQEAQLSSTMIPFYDLFYDQIKEIIKEEKQALDSSIDFNSSVMLSAVSGPLNQTGHYNKY